LSGRRRVCGKRPGANEPSLDDVAANLIFGGPETVLERVRQYEALGIDEQILYVSFGSEHARVIESIRAFGEVLPQLRRTREERGATRHRVIEAVAG
jgi:hypothetical protein